MFVGGFLTEALAEASVKSWRSLSQRLQPEVELIIAKTRFGMVTCGLCAAVIGLAALTTQEFATHDFSKPLVAEVLFVRFLWQALALVILLALTWLNPSQIVMNVCYMLLMSALPFLLLDEFCPSTWVPVAVASVWLMRCCLLPLCDSISLVLLCNAVCHVFVVKAATRSLESDLQVLLQDKLGAAANVIRTLDERGRLDGLAGFFGQYVEASRMLDIGISLSFAALCLWMRGSLVMNVTQFVQMTGMKSEGRACSSLLATICDAHFFLDKNLRLENNEPGLASILFHGSKNQGAAFPQYIATEEDRLHFLKVINEDQSNLARVMHLSLRDGVGTVLPVELFHVKVCGMLGHQGIRHLLGLREYGDTLPESRQALQDKEAEMIHRIPSSPRVPSVDSMPGVADSDNSSAEDLERGNDRNERPYILFDAKTLEVISPLACRCARARVCVSVCVCVSPFFPKRQFLFLITIAGGWSVLQCLLKTHLLHSDMTKGRLCHVPALVIKLAYSCTQG